MYYSKSAALREHVNTLAAVLLQYKSKNLSDLEYTRKISCMVTEAYRLRRRNNGKPFVPATVSEWMNMYLNGPSVCKSYKKEPNQIYVPIKINTGYRDAITTLTMVLETIMGTNTASNYFNEAKTDNAKKTNVEAINKQLFDMLTHTKFSEKLNIKNALNIDKFDDLKNYTKVFDEVFQKVIALSSGNPVSIEKATDANPGMTRTAAITFKAGPGGIAVDVTYTPVFKLDNANDCNIIKIVKEGTKLINLHPFLIGGAAANTYYIMNSAIYKDDKDKLHTLQSVYVEKTTDFFYMQDGKTLLNGKDLDKLKIVEGYFCYDKEGNITDKYIIDDQTAIKSLEFLLLGNINKNSNEVAALANFNTGIDAEKIKEYAGMDAVGTTIILNKSRDADKPTTSASRGLEYLNRLIKLTNFNAVKDNIAKARDAEKSYITYFKIGVTIASVVILQGIVMGLMQSSPIAEAVNTQLTMCAASPGISNIPINIQNTTFAMLQYNLV